MRPQAGIALVIVLWVIALLSVIAGGFAMGMRTHTTLTFNQLAAAQAKALAEGGVQRAILDLLEAEQDRLWRDDGTPNQLTLGGGKIEIAILDESGKVDLNTAQDDLLNGLLRVMGVTDNQQRDALVDAIADWRDPDDLKRLNGAEAADYKAAGLPYGPKNGPFDSVDELQQVYGMSRELFQRLRPFVTVHSQQPTVNPMVAPREVLLALPGMDEAQVDTYLEARSQAVPGAPQPLPPVFQNALVAGRSTLIYSIRSTGVSAQGGVATVQAVVRITRAPLNPATILDWTED